MNESYQDLVPLGWSEWFAARVDAPTGVIARVAAVDRELLLLMDGTGSFRAKLAGSYLYRVMGPDELPCVGDWVEVERQSGDDVGLIRGLLERRTMLRRKAAGDSAGYQMIAANVDCAIVVQSCHFDFNVNRLERYLVMVRDGGADACVLLTKTDLVEPAELATQVEAIRAAGITAPVLTLSNVTRAGVDDLRERLEPGLTYCFVGSSGVGKSTLINHLSGRGLLETAAVSGTGQGRHTTVRRELIVLAGGALVIDNPGMRELGILAADDGIADSFADIAALAPYCRFRDCTHVNEPGCAVREAIDTGEIGQAHYANYIKLRKEAAFHQMSDVEKRHKDRAFGKYLKSAKKSFGYE